MQTQKIDYQHNQTLLEGFLAFDEHQSGKRPAILIAHDWSGRNEFAEKKAQALSELGYVAFALDMYGKGIIGKDHDEKSKLMTPLVENRMLLRERILSALNTLKKIEIVDHNKIAAIGFCFGGLCVLDLARSGIDIRGVVSFHGLLGAPDLAKEKIKAKILALHGHDDPMGLPELALTFQKEMTDAGADWQMNIYGNTMHAFTNPLANDANFGTVYNSNAEKRSWTAMKNFFDEIFI